METPTPSSHTEIGIPIKTELAIINNKWIPHITCPICNGIFRLPIVECGKCKKTACSICLEKKLNEVGHCPLSEGCSNYESFPYFINPLLQPLLDEL